MEKISVIVEEEAAAEAYRDGTLGTPRGTTKQRGVKGVEVDKLRKSVQQLTRQVSAMLAEAEKVKGFKLKEVKLSAEISASGELNIIGSTIGAGVKGAVTFTFSR